MRRSTAEPSFMSAKDTTASPPPEGILSFQRLQSALRTWLMYHGYGKFGISVWTEASPAPSPVAAAEGPAVAAGEGEGAGFVAGVSCAGFVSYDELSTLGRGRGA